MVRRTSQHLREGRTLERILINPGMVELPQEKSATGRHEMFGDGIVSAIDFTIDMEKVTGDHGEDRGKITLNGKWLEYKRF